MDMQEPVVASTIEVEEEPTSPARTRTILTVEERVNHIMAMMETLTFQRGKTCRALAEEWGFVLATVEAHAAEASRRVLGDKEQAREECVRDITAGARRLLRNAVIAKDAHAFKAVGSLWSDITGASKRFDERDAQPGLTEVHIHLAADDDGSQKA